MITLTYDDARLPPGGTLVPKDLQDFLKRFRRAIEPTRIRFYAVGEYGERSGRPHYHIAMFGFPHCETPNYQRRTRKPCPCRRCVLVRSTWGKGIVDLGFTSITKDSAQYVAGYVTKKLTRSNDPRAQEILKGRHPEFARMSLKPGIGAGVVDDICDVLTGPGVESIIRNGDIPVAINHGARSWPLGRYLRRLIRERLGFYETGAQPGWEKQMAARTQETLLELCIQEGCLGLIKKEEETEADYQFKKTMNVVHGSSSGWKKELITQANQKHNERLSHQESLQKKKGRPL